MLNTASATADAIALQSADACAAQAMTRPLAGFGAGAFASDGARVGSQAAQAAASLALPRIKSDKADFGSGHAGLVVVGGKLGSATADAYNFIQMAQPSPVTPGGVGPHPAREPVPV